MQTLIFDTNQNGTKFKMLNATNGGPWHNRHTNDQFHSNFLSYKAARIPYSRNHDSADNSVYGGPYSHDITNIFPNFDADVNDPASYDFACTDEAILTCLEAGTQTFFRLGQTIEHQVKKHGTIPPKDFEKWAQICEHIIAHYNEGWADGFNLNMQYWEIWNEPDLDEKSDNKKTWGGTRAQFFDLYETAAKHLKARFPNLKIGGPALAGNLLWAKEFLFEMQKRSVPIDFFSWHIYTEKPSGVVWTANEIRKLLDNFGYKDTESHLNEWNYVRGWSDEFPYTIKAIHGMKGAAFTMASISEGQNIPLDMMMYYDTRPSIFNGVFDFYTCEPLKGYYPLYWYGMLYDMEKSIVSQNRIENVYSLCGVDKSGKILSIITYYTPDDNAENKEISIDFGKKGNYEIYLLDEENDGTLIETTDCLNFNLKRQSIVLIKEV